MATSAKGQLLIKLLEASGENKDKQQLWDQNFVQGFVKGMALDRGCTTVGSFAGNLQTSDPFMWVSSGDKGWIAYGQGALS